MSFRPIPFPARALAAALMVAAGVAAARGVLVPGGAQAVEAGAARPLPFLYDIYTFRGEGGTVVVASYAVEAGELERESHEGQVRYRFDVSLVLTDTLRRTVLGRHDSVYVDGARPLPADHLLFTAIELQAPPSATVLQRVYMYNATLPGIGQFYTAGVPVPDYGGSDFMLSDIALGQPDAANGWRRGDAVVALLPTRQFPGSAFQVYYEVYNLPRDHDLRTEIAVTEVPGDELEPGPEVEPMARLRFDSEAPSGGRVVLQQMRRVESSLGRGRYRITVTVTDLHSGRVASRSRYFEVHAGRRAATMVPALPVTVSRGTAAGRWQE
jgi:hypothetical protein